MGRTYTLVNTDKKERISFYHVNTGTKVSELSGTIVASSIVTYYMLSNIGDKISFVDDNNTEAELFGKRYTRQELNEYIEVTETIVHELISEGLYRDDGITWIDKEEKLWDRDLTNIFDPKMDRPKLTSA
jgi:hypothetical protein